MEVQLHIRDWASLSRQMSINVKHSASQAPFKYLPSAAPEVWDNLPMSPSPWFSISLKLLFENIFFLRKKMLYVWLVPIALWNIPYATGFCSVLATYTLAGFMLYAVKHCGVHSLCLIQYRLKVGLNSQKLKYCCKAFFLQESSSGAKDSSTVSC